MAILFALHSRDVDRALILITRVIDKFSKCARPDRARFNLAPDYNGWHALARHSCGQPKFGRMCVIILSSIQPVFLFISSTRHIFAAESKFIKMYILLHLIKWNILLPCVEKSRVRVNMMEMRAFS